MATFRWKNVPHMECSDDGSDSKNTNKDEEEIDQKVILDLQCLLNQRNHEDLIAYLVTQTFKGVSSEAVRIIASTIYEQIVNCGDHRPDALKFYIDVCCKYSSFWRRTYIKSGVYVEELVSKFLKDIEYLSETETLAYRKKLDLILVIYKGSEERKQEWLDFQCEKMKKRQRKRVLTFLRLIPTFLMERTIDPENVYNLIEGFMEFHNEDTMEWLCVLLTDEIEHKLWLKSIIEKCYNNSKLPYRPLYEDETDPFNQYLKAMNDFGQKNNLTISKSLKYKMCYLIKLWKNEWETHGLKSWQNDVDVFFKQRDVKLNTVDNSWKPNRLLKDTEQSEEERQTEELYKNVRGILNKLTPQKFDTLMKRIMALPINSEEKLNGVVKLIFEKAVDEPKFSKAYANMSKICSKMEVSKVENGHESKVNFRKILITRCQIEFESSRPAELDAVKHQEEIKNCTDTKQKKELQLAYEEKERFLQMKSVGNIRFIGELYKMGMLTQAIMYRCIEHLLNNPEEESLECLCKLLSTIGRDLEFPSNQKPSPQSLNQYFLQMSKLAQKRESSKVSSRVRFMLQDVIDLRKNEWVPKRDDVSSRVRFMLQDVIDLRKNRCVPKRYDNNSKTIDELYKTTAPSQLLPWMNNRQNDRQDKRCHRRCRGNNNQNEDGCESLGSSSSNYKLNSVFEGSKMLIKPDAVDLNSLSLGGSSQIQFVMNTPKPVETKTGVPFASSNLFSGLSRGGDERKPPHQPYNMNKRITPTPSIEKDKVRQRMIQGVVEGSEKGTD